MLSVLFAAITPDERELISQNLIRLKQGDNDALEEIYHICGGRLLSVAMGITRDMELAKDVLQDSLVRAVKYCDRFRGGNGYAWLCTVVRNVALTAVKDSGKRAGYDIDGFFSLADGSDIGEQTSLRVTVTAALKKLSARERTAIWLKYYNDMTVREIAAELNIPRSTAFEVLQRGEKQLKQLLKEQ